MAEAPKSRGFGSLLGRSMGVAVEGIQPEIVRNRATPDAASQSGQPWPDSAPTYHRFTHSGVITLDEPSAPFVAASGTRLVGARCDVAAGSDDATVGVYVDGSLVDSVSWSGAPTAVAVDFDEMLAADSSRLTVAFTAGSGSASVSIRFEMSL